MYESKTGFGDRVVCSIRCLNLPVKPARAKLWNRAEPVYYRLYRSLKSGTIVNVGTLQTKSFLCGVSSV